MDPIIGKVVSVHVGIAGSEFEKQTCLSLKAELDGIIGDRHRGIERETWVGDKQAEGTKRRNERQWSAVSVEEIAVIEQVMGIQGQLNAAGLGANLCLEGIDKLSQLPLGTILVFPSGAELRVEEYNPPCSEMSQRLAMLYSKNSVESLAATDFSKAAKFSRGLVGVVEVAGTINAGDAVIVKPYQAAPWLQRLAEEGLV